MYPFFTGVALFCKEMPAPHCELGLVDMKANGLLAKNVWQKKKAIAVFSKKEAAPPVFFLHKT